MAILDQIFGSGIKGVGDMIKEVVGSFKLDPTVQAQIAQQVEDHKFELEKLDREIEARMADDASANIQAEAKSNWYTACARPTFMYVIELILFWNYFIGPVFHRDPVVLPGDLLVLFGTALTGYVAARTYEKTQGVS